MSTAPQRAARVAADTPDEQNEWLDEQTAHDAELADAMATYDVTHAADKVPHVLAEQSQRTTTSAHTQGVVMQGRNKWTAMILAVGIVGSLAACGSGSSDDESQVVGVALPTKEQARWVADGDNLKKQFTSLGYDVEMLYAGDDAAAQADQIQKLIDDGADALVVGAVDGTALKAVLANAASEDIPVIAYDRLIRDSGDIDYYASFNNFQVGVMEGRALLAGMGVIDASGKPTGRTGVNIEVFAGSPDDNNATFFYDGAMSVVRPFIDAGVISVPSGQVERLDVAIQGWKNDVAGQRMTTLLAPYQAGKHLDGVLAPNDGIAQAIIGAVKPALGYVPAVPGQDAEIPAIKSIAAGEQIATVYKDTRTLAEVTVGMVRELLKGNEPEINDTTSYDNGVKVVPSYLLTPQMVTKDNYKHVLVDGGYYTEAEIG
ncbi:sugar-binding protein [Cellulomonas sp. URHE0023]|uniref:substrate-binding domain-containing protein n=1 Tax=Cellulomonas sp. URHE0023 TaxID=1380354 RepID=UPI000B128581|nr:sugar-binding protein [Cellulomonas sp. URHE0023]